MALDLSFAGATSVAPAPTAPLLVQGLRVDLCNDPAGIVLVLHGDADLATAPLLAEALAQSSGNGHADVVLDATALDFIDANSLGIIANARTLLRDRGRDLVVRSPPPLLRRVLTIIDMEDLIEQAHGSERRVTPR